MESKSTSVQIILLMSNIFSPSCSGLGQETALPLVSSPGWSSWVVVGVLIVDYLFCWFPGLRHSARKLSCRVAMKGGSTDQETGLPSVTVIISAYVFPVYIGFGKHINLCLVGLVSALSVLQPAGPCPLRSRWTYLHRNVTGLELPLKTRYGSFLLILGPAYMEIPAG